MKIARMKLEKMIREEITRGFGQGDPAKDEISKKREVYLEEEAEPSLAAATRGAEVFAQIMAGTTTGPDYTEYHNQAFAALEALAMNLGETS